MGGKSFSKWGFYLVEFGMLLFEDFSLGYSVIDFETICSHGSPALQYEFLGMVTIYTSFLFPAPRLAELPNCPIAH